MAAYSNSDSRFDTAAPSTIANLVPLPANQGDLAIVVVGTTGQAAAASVADDNAGGASYSFIATALRTTSADVMSVYIRNAPLASAGTTFTGTLAANSGAFIGIILVSGMTRYGAAAIRNVAGLLQFTKEQNQTTGNPQPSYNVPALPANFQLTALFTNVNPPGCPGPSPAWTSRINGGYATPTSGFQAYTIDSGDSSTTVQWQGSSGNAYSDFTLELDTSPDAGAALATTPIPPLGRGATW